MEKFVFDYIRCNDLPKLGWCMIVKKNTPKVKVYMGDYVEITDSWFVAGVWDGDFLAADFENTEFLCATAVKNHGESITVYSHTHERQRFSYLKRDEEVYFSNSIPLLLAITDEAIDKNCDQYEEILCAILKGTKDYDPVIPLANGKEMYQVFCADLTIDMNLCFNKKRKKRHRDFVDFEDYLSSVTSMCERTRDNGKDINRSHKYELATTASSGYDSATCAAIAKKVGCDTLLTFKGGKYDADSAVEIGKQLGYKNIVERGDKDYLDKKGCIDVNYFVDGDLGAYLQFSAFEDDFANHIVFSGTSGSYIWDKDAEVNEDSIRYSYNFYTANLSFAENSIRKGYVFFPMALYGSSAVESIQKITNSPEMEPWTLHTSYDRPICRRILETSGVKRETFGQKKYGGGFSLARNFTKKQFRNKMSKEGFKEFCDWIEIKGNNEWTIGRIGRLIQYHLETIPDYTAYVLRKIGIFVESEKVVPYPNPGLPAKLIVWSMEKLSNEYKNALLSTNEKRVM